MIGNTLVLLASLQFVSLPLVSAQDSWCDKVGWDAGYESFSSCNSGSYSGCASQCSRYKQCKSFAYSSNDCQLYDKVVKGNFVADGGSPYTFNDATCQKTGTTTTTTKTTTKATTTTTTTKKTTTTSSTTTKITTTSAKPTTITTTTTKKSTTTTAKSSSTGGAVCHQLGYFIGPDEDTVSIDNTWGRLPKSTTTKLHCYNSCVGFRGCLSYAWNEGSCTLFNTTLAGNFRQDSDSVADFYDLACGAPPATSDDVTSTTTTTTTKKITTTAAATTTPKATSTGSAICDQLGYFIGPDQYTVSIDNTWGRLPKSTTTKLHCYNSCVGFKGCLSYAWNEGSCTLFSTTLAGNFKQDSSSVADFYDLKCGAPPAVADDAATTVKARRGFQIRR